MYGVELVRHGFSAADAQQLVEARDALEAAGVGRTGAQGDDRATTQAHRDALAAARQSGSARRRCWAVAAAFALSELPARAPRAPKPQ